MTFSKKIKIFLIILPILLIPSTALAFTIFQKLFGNDLGYILGFIFYWIFCWTIPLLIFGKNIGVVFNHEKKLLQKNNWDVIAILLLIIIVSVFMYFIPNLKNISLLLIVISPVAIITGVSEEALWRGSFVVVFKDNFLLSCIVPATGFALSHLSPQIIYPADSGVIPFTISTLFLGLAFGWIAYRMKSARWPAIIHSLIALLAFGEPVTSSIIRLIQK